LPLAAVGGGQEILPAARIVTHHLRYRQALTFPVLGRSALGCNSLVLAEVRWQASVVASDVVWWPTGPAASRESATALVVSYNTRELTAFLLWSLRTIVSWPELEIVVVDNGSRDGSAQLLAEAGRGGVCTLLANHDNRHHGPGLNQGISYLASRPGLRPAWNWILDSDVVAARPGALSAAVTVAREYSAALLGEPQHDQWHPDGRFGQYSRRVRHIRPRQGIPFIGGIRFGVRIS
jgi:hypothetical protein